MNELVCDCNVPGFDPAKGWTLYVCVCVALLVGVSGLRTNHRRRRGCVLFYYKIVLLNSFIRSVPHNVFFFVGLFRQEFDKRAALRQLDEGFGGSSFKQS